MIIEKTEDVAKKNELQMFDLYEAHTFSIYHDLFFKGIFYISEISHFQLLKRTIKIEMYDKNMCVRKIKYELDFRKTNALPLLIQEVTNIFKDMSKEKESNT